MSASLCQLANSKRMSWLSSLAESCWRQKVLQHPPPPPPLLSILGLGSWQANGRASSPVTPHPGKHKTSENGGAGGSWFIWHITEHQDKLAAACSQRADQAVVFKQSSRMADVTKSSHTSLVSHTWIPQKCFLFVEIYDKKKKCDWARSRLGCLASGQRI